MVESGCRVQVWLVISITRAVRARVIAVRVRCANRFDRRTLDGGPNSEVTGTRNGCYTTPPAGTGTTQSRQRTPRRVGTEHLDTRSFLKKRQHGKVDRVEQCSTEHRAVCFNARRSSMRVGAPLNQVPVTRSRGSLTNESSRQTECDAFERAHTLASEDGRGPGELKHIISRWKRNQQGRSE